MSKKYLFPYELIELNWRFWSFMGLLAVGRLSALSFPVAEFSGYIDPLYSPTVLILPLPTLFRLSCYAYRKDYHRHIFDHPLGLQERQRGRGRTQSPTPERGTPSSSSGTSTGTSCTLGSQSSRSSTMTSTTR